MNTAGSFSWSLHRPCLDLSLQYDSGERTEACRQRRAQQTLQSFSFSKFKLCFYSIHTISRGLSTNDIKHFLYTFSCCQAFMFFIFFPTTSDFVNMGECDFKKAPRIKSIQIKSVIVILLRRSGKKLMQGTTAHREI